VVESDRVRPRPEPLVHLCAEREWAAACAAGELRPESLGEAGFVHLSAQSQVHLPANRLFAGRVDMLLLFLDPDRLGAPVRWEPGVPTDPASMLFPHLYGPLPADAVLEVIKYVPGPDGRFAPLIHRSPGWTGKPSSP
jgi:uncharacterized protein (DUF952 family)